MSTSFSVLLVEDDQSQRELIQGILTQAGHQVVDVDSVESAILKLKTQNFDVIFSDWKLGTLTGLDLLNYVKRNEVQSGFAIATAYGTIAHAVEAINAGADDYLAKPFQKQELLLCIDKTANAGKLRSNNNTLKAALTEQQSLVDLVGNAPCMQKVYSRIERVSKTTATVLINGESGTGKELAARALHRLSDRNSNAFIAVNCGAIPESIAEAELFGSLKGAFTGANADKVGQLEAANGGTLFLDEIGELPLSIQAKLLRFLQESTITPVGGNQSIELDVRVIAATHRNLSEMVQQGTFREDLYYRLNIVPIEMPPLRERKEDIAKLLDFFLSKFASRYAVDKPSLDSDTLKRLMDYDWPGNVRELSNRLERFILLGDEQELLQGMSTTIQNGSVAGFVLTDAGLDWEDFEQSCLQQAIALSKGNKTAAAKLLHLNYKAFLYRLEKYGLS
ncbi:MAG: response regulator [Alteromonadaceae bacterium]|nr:response regulator [Alteromonadaceae bacterium]